jgi:hypothetical protein
LRRTWEKKKRGWGGEDFVDKEIEREGEAQVSGIEEERKIKKHFPKKTFPPTFLTTHLGLVRLADIGVDRVPEGLDERPRELDVGLGQRELLQVRDEEVRRGG